MGKRLPFLLATIGVLFLAASFVCDIALIDVASHRAETGVQERFGDAIALVAWLRTIGLFGLIIGGFLFLTRVIVKRGK